MPAVIVLAMDDRVGGGSTGDTDYGLIGTSYSRYRRPDPRLAAAVAAALGGARTVLNIGAGAGSYEPKDRTVTAVEPSAAMRAQRLASMPAVDATAEALPFPDGSFDAAMSTFSVHQWHDLVAGPNACLTRRRGCPAQRGASSRPTCTSASSLTWHVTSRRTRGMTATAPYATSRHSTAPWF